MRVAIHAGQLRAPVPGGIGRYVRLLAAALPGAGVDVTLFASGSRPEGLDEGAAWHDQGRPGGTLRYELWHRLRRPRVRAAGDLLHAPSLAVPPPSGRPLVVTVHDVAFLREPDTFTRRGRAFHRRGLALARRDAATLVAPSAFTRDELVAEGFDADRIHVVHHPAVVPEPPPPEEIAWQLARAEVAEPYLLTVGTVEPRKNLPVLLDAHAALRRDHPDLTLVVAGRRGWGSPPPLARDGVVHLDGAADATLEALYRRAVACCLPSRYEGFGMPALEAMARGVPVVVSRGGALEEVVADAGLLVDPSDPEGIAAALDAVLVDARLRERLARRGLEHAATFTREAFAAGHAAAYRQALAG
jgi:glycosyltransferase involved in cell wall biosynthesis